MKPLSETAAVNSFLILAPNEKAVTDVIVAQRTVRIYLLGKVKHLLSQIVLAHFGISNYAIAIAGFELLVKLLDTLESVDSQIV